MTRYPNDVSTLRAPACCSPPQEDLQEPEGEAVQAVRGESDSGSTQSSPRPPRAHVSKHWDWGFCTIYVDLGLLGT